MAPPIEFVDVDVDDRSVSLGLVAGGRRTDVHFRASVPLALGRADPLLPLGLLAAMRTDAPLHLPALTSARLLRNSGRLQDVLAAFSDRRLTPTRIVAEPGPTPAPPGRGTGAFFSAGVDSFYTALKRAPELTHLVYVSGFDVLDPASRRAQSALAGVRAAAADLGKELIEVETNIRAITDPYETWHLAHGIGIAAVALLLQGQLERIYVPASFAYADLAPWGTHPLLDPLWGTEAIDLVHDGCELVRAEKVARIASHEVVLARLRVCNQQASKYNCGKCEKCVRTMMNLRLAGALPRARTLPTTVTVQQVAGLRPFVYAERVADAQQPAAGPATGDWAMVGALTVALRPHPLLRVRHALGRAEAALLRRR